MTRRAQSWYCLSALQQIPASLPFLTQQRRVPLNFVISRAAKMET